MTRQAAALGALVVLVQAKAIITNKCHHDVYLWSVPTAGDTVADNLAIQPGHRYEEPWHNGTPINPGIAIKVSPKYNGITNGKSEINFAYSVDGLDASKIWVSLSTVRGKAFDNNLAFYTCKGVHKASEVSTHICGAGDDIELVICGIERTSASEDSTPLNKIAECTTEHHDQHNTKKRTARPRHCNARVVGPKRLSSPKPTDGAANDHKDPPTVPLKTVIQHENAKHGAASSFHNISSPECHTIPRNPSANGIRTTRNIHQSDTPICDLVRSKLPGMECDEKMAQHNAKILYDQACEEPFRNMFSIDCDRLRNEIKKIKPEIEDTPSPISRVVSPEHGVCIIPALRKLPHAFGPPMQAELRLHEAFPNAEWTHDDAVCANYTLSMSQSLPFANLEKRKPKLPKQCVKPWCEPAIPHADCSDIEDVFEYISKDLLHAPVDWTTDRRVCNAATEHVSKNLGRQCVKPYCEPLVPGVNCTLFGNRLEALSRKHGYEVEYTTDDTICNPPANMTIVGKKHGKPLVCMRPVCDLLHAKRKDCERFEDRMEEWAKLDGQNVDYTTDEDVCLKRKIPVDAKPPTAKRQEKPTCWQYLCDPSVPGVDCEAAISVLWAILNQRKVDIEEWNLLNKDPEACKPLLANHKNGKYHVCVAPICRQLRYNKKECKAFKNDLEGAAKRVHHMKIDYTTDEEHCRKPQNSTTQHLSKASVRPKLE